MTSGKIAVVTGASSGIGMAISLRLAKEDINLVLASRNKFTLNNVKKECINFGPSVECITCDVSKENEVKKLNEFAIKKFGKIDIWINNAAVYTVGRFIDIPTDVFKQTLKINFLGYVYGVRAVLNYMIKEKKGIIINIISVDGLLPTAYTSAYTASKFALTGFMSAIREELEATGVKICNIYPSAINTPLYSVCPNYYGKETKPPDPVYSPHKVAEKVYALTENPKQDTIVGWYGKLGSLLYRIAPRITTSIFAKQIRLNAFTDNKIESREGNVYSSLYEKSEIEGRW